MPKLSQIILFCAAAIVAMSAGVWLRAHFMDGPQPPLSDAMSKQGAEAILSANLPDLNGVSQPVSQWKGDVIIANFWATWCTPCREEIPEFIEMQQEYQDQGLTFIGIAIDQKEKVVAYSREFGINYPVLIGGLSAMSLAEAAGNEMSVLPYTVIFDRQGNISDTFLGRVHKKTLEKSIMPLLQQGQAKSGQLTQPSL
ncbi:TlpA disulfide reductase family protein [Nitrosomonas sp.]|uniref:TlpA family protein disulfide reductase n=1 Tax=Nitrosomonas sp. TaxID=42353 RepID=UPI001D1B4FF7|nr:TlpA disulfide reductase family protein [Nitrosomonas sp.]MCB1948647.1 TlpA family protein disulfide reductase [Nitrosomonas sp.]MCP5243226.1 TlpA family protein disulfide reductase [Burkholderiales bacterium]MDR4514003.1 TlpA family protein disulfide reductase [Nitrosomonas sp.]